MYLQQRPPTAPPTPDNGDMSNSAWPIQGGGGPHHYPQGASLVPPGFMYDRSRFPPPSGGLSLSSSQNSAFAPQPSDQHLAASSSSAAQRNRTPLQLNLNQGGNNQPSHQPSSHQAALNQAHQAAMNQANQANQMNQLPLGANSSAPSLLLDNLAQHLNNPPGPGSAMGQSYPPGSGMSGQQTGGGQSQGPVGRLLLMPNGGPPPAGSEEEKIYILITELLDPETREAALLELSKKRETYEDLALVLWGGFGVMSSLLLEIVNVYPALSPPNLTAHASNRVCNALALLQCVASHTETRALFLNAHVPLFLYPFLNTTSKTRPFEYLRLTSLGVVGALVKQNENSDVINFLLSTEIIPLCLRIMETGSELSKTVAIFIVQKILLDDLGLQYICQTYERFYAVGAVLANMVQALQDSQAVRLLKHVVRCYLRMSDNPRAREALRACLPEALRDGTFGTMLKGDMVTKRCLQTLLSNLDGGGPNVPN